MFNYINFLVFLEQAGIGCISGHVSEWPQLKPACAWAVGEIARLKAVIIYQENRIRELEGKLPSLVAKMPT